MQGHRDRQRSKTRAGGCVAENTYGGALLRSDRLQLGLCSGQSIAQTSERREEREVFFLFHIIMGFRRPRNERRQREHPDTVLDRTSTSRASAVAFGLALLSQVVVTNAVVSPPASGGSRDVAAGAAAAAAAAAAASAAGDGGDTGGESTAGKPSIMRRLHPASKRSSPADRRDLDKHPLTLQF